MGIAAAALVYDRFVTPTPPAPLARTIDRIMVEKADRRLTVYRDGAALRVYRISLGHEPVGDKTRQGDGRTPEGLFRIDRRNLTSRFHLSLGLDYPQPAHAARAAAGGYGPGGDIFIHGQPPGLGPRQRLNHDRTAGCIAVSNAVVEELWRVTELGTLVEVTP